MKKLTLTIPAITLLCFSYAVSAGEVTATFNDGEVLTQEKLDNVKSAVNDNNDRISQLEAGPATEVAVDCNSDANALINTAIKNNTNYVLTGTCNGPIKITGSKAVSLTGDATGSKDDGIELPSGLSQDPSYVLGVFGPNRVSVTNLTLSGQNYLTDSLGSYVKGISAADGASMRIEDVNISGSGDGVRAYRNGTVNFIGDNQVTGFSRRGLTAEYAGHITISDSIVVVGLSNTTADSSEAVIARRSGSVEIQGGGTFTPALTGANLDETTGLWVSESGSLFAENNGLTATVVNMGSGASFNNALSTLRSGSLRFMGGTINGDISSRYASYLRVNSSDINANSISVGDTAGLDIRDSDLGGIDVNCGQFVAANVGSSNTNLGLVCGQ